MTQAQSPETAVSASSWQLEEYGTEETKDQQLNSV